MRDFVAAAGLGAMICLAQPAIGAPLTYDCQARMARVETIPAPAPGDTDPWQCTAPTAPASSAIHWQRNSLEYCRIATGLYGEALAAARRIARTHRPHRWIVFLDADETVLDNSLFERERSRCAEPVRDAQWESWVAADMARDVPGAAAFTQGVHKLGGLVAVVTNRAAADDAITRRTLKKAAIWFDYEIGMTGDHPDKTLRWQGAVAALTTKRYGRPVAALWLGDQMSDLGVADARGRISRAMGQDERSTAGLGERLFLLPNPMYGNWLSNPDR